LGKSKGIKWLVVGLLTLALLIGGGCNVNTAPIIYSLTPSDTTVGPGDSSTISCSASDPNGDTLSYAWSVNGGAITGIGSTATWTAPETEGNYYITVTVSDGRGGTDSESTIISVANTPPSIASLTPSATAVGSGDTCTVDCIASDPNGDSLSYAWSANGGAITGTGSTATWTAPATEGTYSVTVTVSDGRGGIDSESCNITVEIVFGSLNIQSTPLGAAIFLNGVDTGNITPWATFSLTPGDYTVRLELEYYKNREETITVNANQTTFINWALNYTPMLLATIQPDGIEGKDSYVRDDLPTANYGSDNYLAAGTNISGDISRAYIQFDLTGLPPNVVITEATLILDHYSSEPMASAYIGAYPVTAAWGESIITFSNQPSVTVLEAAFLVPSTVGVIEWDITNMVQGWYEGSIPNYGLMLGAVDETSLEAWAYFRSSDYATASQRPKLLITYYDPNP
jgi:hypothetical protein